MVVAGIEFVGAISVKLPAWSSVSGRILEMSWHDCVISASSQIHNSQKNWTQYSSVQDIMLRQQVQPETLRKIGNNIRLVHVR